MAIEQINRRRPYRAVVKKDGKRLSKSFARKTDAETWQRKMLLSVELGVSPEEKPKEIVLKPLLDEFRQRFERDYSEHRQAPSTRVMEKRLYELYVSASIGRMRIDEIRRKDVQELLLDLSQKEELSNQLVNRVRTQLHCMFNQAVLWELLEVNPVIGTQPLPQKNYIKEEAINYLSQQEASTLLDWIRDNDAWLYPKVRTLLNTGMRYGEMAALRVCDFIATPQGGRLFISRGYCRHSKQILNRTKGRRSRVVPLGLGMSQFLSEQGKGRKTDLPLLWEDWIEMIHQTKFNKHFAKALKETKVRRIRVHDLRHTFAVHFLERGGQLYDLQKLLGHHSIRLTERYSHFSSAMSERSRGLVDHHAPFTEHDGE